MERLGPYQLVRRIATGGMAEVYLARQVGIEGFEREVVIKRILPHRAQDDEFSTMFLDEARLVARLNHPFVAQIYDLGRENNAFFIAMEYVHGVDLAHLIDLEIGEGSPGLPLTVSLPILAALCEALEYIHTRTDEFGQPLNIVHRDLNPKNVIIAYDGAVKLIDFGIAKAASQVYETRTGVIKGTYGYMAPEQVSRQRPIDARADLFSLGVLAYEITTGQHPFDATDEVAVLGKLVRCQFVPPSQVVSQYPAELEQLIQDCMALLPKGRPPRARDVLRRLEDFALEQKVPLTMRPVGEFVLDRDADGKTCTFISQLAAEENAASTADLSRDLAQRADQNLVSVTTSLLQEADQSIPSLGPLSWPSDPSGPAPRLSRRNPHRAGRFFMIAMALAFAVVSGYLGYSQLLEPALVGSAGLVQVFGAHPQNDAAGVVDGDRPQPTVDASRDVAIATNDSTAATKAAPLLRVESDPPNAAIVVEGTRTGKATPAEVPVPSGHDLVWIRVELDGYQPVERQVHTGAGAALFTLAPLSDDGDAQ
jgi:serine/threonine protein kinase